MYIYIYISSRKLLGLMFPSRFCLKGMIFAFFSLLLFFFFFQVCKQLLKGIVYPLAVKSTKALDLTHQKEHVAPWCSWIQFPPFTGTLSLSLFIKNFKIQFKCFGIKSLLNFLNIYK